MYNEGIFVYFVGTYFEQKIVHLSLYALRLWFCFFIQQNKIKINAAATRVHIFVMRVHPPLSIFYNNKKKESKEARDLL